jgi:hypothetical protein
LAHDRVGGGSFDILDVETPEELLVSGRLFVIPAVVLDDLVFGDGGVVAQSLEVFAVGGFEIFLSLGYFRDVVG